MMMHATLYRLRQHLGLSADDTNDDQRLLDALIAASAAIERHTRRCFQPYFTTIWHDIQLRDVTELLLTDDLLHLTYITNGDSSTIPLSDVLQVADGILRLINGQVFIYDETPQAAIGVTGYWGYHPNWGQAWLDSGDSVQDTSLNSTATIITVNDADAGETPRFQIGQLLRLEDEFLHVIGVNSGSNTLSVVRGVQGTSATPHANSTSIEIYQTPADVAQLTLRWALWLYREPDHFAETLPPILEASLNGLRRFTVRS